MGRAFRYLFAIVLLGVCVPFLPARAEPVANDPFQRTWQRTDQPVASGAVSRTWMWGPEPFTGSLREDYAESPGGKREVQYFDKSRMEITHPDGDQSSPWYVTNGLLVVELMTGRMQVGDGQFEDREPARINVAGDPDDPLTYAVLDQLRDDPALAVGAAVTQRVDASGAVRDDASLAAHGVTAATLVGETGHTVASPFWAFMHSSGLVHVDGGMTNAPLFESPFYATGLPITEAYWADVRIGGSPRLVLLQCFERRCLTYTPDNPVEWQVEAGNVGQHYHRWRYPAAAPGPSERANELARAVVQAGSDDARTAALLAVMDALHVGVYTTSGQQVVGGAERAAADFYLYDVELRMLAAALGRGQTFGVADLAIQLSELGLLPEGQMLDPATVRSALLAVVDQARERPDAFGSLSPLIVRQLVLSQPAPADLFADPPLDAIRFDPLAFFLLLAHATIPLVEDGLPMAAGASSGLLAQSNGVLKPAVVDPCNPTGFVGDTVKPNWGWLKNFADLMSLLPQGIAKASQIVDGIHGAVLAASVRVTGLDSRLETHYGHESDGMPITFRVKVEMLDQLPQTLIQCGWIAGIDFPNAGPIPEVSVHWFWDDLEEHGRIECGNACPSTGGQGLAIDATNTQGIAQMTFFPKKEEDPGEGTELERQGVVTGVALYQSKFTNLLGSYAQYLTPKSGTTRWVVRFHEVPEWEIDLRVTWDIRDQHAPDWYAWAKGSASFQTTIPADTLFEQGGAAVDYTATGGGTYGYTPNPPVNCSAWTGSWGQTTVIELISREPKVVDFMMSALLPVPGQGLTSHPMSGECSIGWDRGMLALSQYPAFSLDEEETQVLFVAPEGIRADLSGTIRWEITVTPKGQ